MFHTNTNLYSNFYFGIFIKSASLPDFYFCLLLVSNAHLSSVSPDPEIEGGSYNSFSVESVQMPSGENVSCSTSTYTYTFTLFKCKHSMQINVLPPPRGSKQ